nr:hypothetical protein [Tanacetum cinerariifolium]
MNHTCNDKPFTPKPQTEDEELSSNEDLDDWLKTKIKRRVYGHDKEGEEDALIAILKSLVDECKAVYTNKGKQIETSSNKTNEVQGMSFVEEDGIQNEEKDISKALPCQLSPKELNPGSFTLPCTIGRNQAPGMVKPKFKIKEKDIKDMTIAECMEYEAEQKGNYGGTPDPIF